MIRVKRGSSRIRQVLIIYLLLFIVFCVMCLYSDSFRSVYNITNLLAQCVPLGCVAMGQTIVILSGGIDLSVGSVISFSTAIAAKVLNTEQPMQIIAGVMLIMIAGAFSGAINGIGINFFKVPPLITTLCMSTVLGGCALWALPMAGGKVNRYFARFVYQKWDILSMPFVILLILFIFIHIILYHTKCGVRIYGIGKNRKVAASMGVNVAQTSVKAYMLCGLCASITGLLLACRMRVGDPTCGTGYTMDSITASVVGGVSMAGGYGLLSGTVAGALLIGMLSNIMNNLAVNQFLQYVLKGSLLVIAMIIYSTINAMRMGRHDKP